MSMQSYLIKTPDGQLSIEMTAQLTGFPVDKYQLQVNLMCLVPEKDSIGINQVKQAISWMRTLQSDQNGKLLLISTAEFLTTEAQNALLKLLEEPGDRNRVMLCSAYPDQLLPTILSRCVLVDLPQTQGSQHDTTHNLRLFSGLLAQSPAERLLSIDKTGITKDTLLSRQFILDTLKYFNANQDKANTLDLKSRLIIMRLAIQTLDMLDCNVNTRLAIETFLLDLPSVR